MGKDEILKVPNHGKCRGNSISNSTFCVDRVNFSISREMISKFLSRGDKSEGLMVVKSKL